MAFLLAEVAFALDCTVVKNPENNKSCCAHPVLLALNCTVSGILSWHINLNTFDYRHFLLMYVHGGL